MRFRSWVLAAAFCAGGSVVWAQVAEERPAAELSVAPVDAGPAEGTGSGSAPVEEPEATDPAAAGQVPSSEATEKGQPAGEAEAQKAEGPDATTDTAAGAVAATAEPGDWVTQPDTAPFDFGMPHDIQADGAYRYAYPVDMPAYRGLEPKITVNYASLLRPRNLENVLGDGWRIGGLSKIERTTVTGGTPAYDNATDILQFDGEELLACGGAEGWSGDYPDDYWADNESASCTAGGDLTATHENFLKIRTTGARGEKDTKLYIYQKNGVRFQYESLAAIANVSLPDSNKWKRAVYDRVWLLTQINDRQENESTVSISYDVGSEAEGYWYRPSEISYAGYSIDFAYVDGQGMEAQTKQKVTPGGLGLYSYQRQRLDHIDVKYGQNLIKNYDLFFEYISDYGQYRLKSILDKGSNEALLSKVELDYSGDSGSPATGPGQFSLLDHVKNERGGVTTIEYGSSLNDNLALNDDPNTGTRKLVKSITEALGPGGNARTVDYFYDESHYDTARSRSLGFHRVVARLPKLEGETERKYIVNYFTNMDYAQNSIISYRSYFAKYNWKNPDSPDNIRVRRINYNYDTTWTGNGPWRALLTGIVRDAWEDGDLVQTTTTYEINKFGEPVKIRSLGYTTSDGTIDEDDSDSLVTAFEYEPDFDRYIVNKPIKIQSIAGPGYTTDPAKRLRSLLLGYDVRGNLTSVMEWSDAGYRQAATYEYDARGNVTKEIGPRAGQVTTHTYGGPHSLFRTSTTNPLGQVRSWTWDTACQAPLTSVDVNGLTTATAYDVFCREALRTLPTNHHIATDYQNLGDPAAQYIETRAQSAATGNPNTISRTYFDGFGQVWKTTRTGASSASADLITTVSHYDERGNLDWKSVPLLGLNPAVPGSERTAYEYDGLDRLIRTRYADGAERQPRQAQRDPGEERRLLHPDRRHRLRREAHEPQWSGLGLSRDGVRHRRNRRRRLRDRARHHLLSRPAGAAHRGARSPGLPVGLRLRHLRGSPGEHRPGPRLLEDELRCFGQPDPPDRREGRAHRLPVRPPRPDDPEARGQRRHRLHL